MEEPHGAADGVGVGGSAGDAEGELEGVGVLVTGSVTVAGEARALLRSRR